MVGRLTLLPRGETRAVAVPDCRSTNDLWRGFAFVGGHCDWRVAALSSGFDLDLIAGLFCFLVLIGAVVGYTAYIWLLRHCEPAKVATYAYVNPIVAVLLGAFFAGETVTMRMLIAAALIIGSVALVITAQQLRARVEPPISVALEPAD